MDSDDLVSVRPEVEQMVGFIRVLEGESAMKVSIDLWQRYINAWFVYQDALSALQHGLEFQRLDTEA